MLAWLRAWTVPVLFLAFVAAEFAAAFVPALRMRTLTRAVVTYLPWPVTDAIVVWLGAWLLPHFADNYKQKGTTVSAATDLTEPQPAAEPLLSVGTVTAAVTAVIGLAVSFGMDLPADRQSAILGVVAVLAPVVVAVLGRRKVFSPASVAKLLASRIAEPPVAPPTA